MHSDIEAILLSMCLKHVFFILIKTSALPMGFLPCVTDRDEAWVSMNDFISTKFGARRSVNGRVVSGQTESVTLLKL